MSSKAFKSYLSLEISPYQSKSRVRVKNESESRHIRSHQGRLDEGGPQPHVAL